MSFKRFRDQDLVYTTLKTHPEYNFIINSGKVYLQKEKTKQGDLSSEALRHVPTGSISLYELNVDRGTTTLATADLVFADAVSIAGLHGNKLTLDDAQNSPVEFTISKSQVAVLSGNTIGLASYAVVAATVHGRHRPSILPGIIQKFADAINEHAILIHATCIGADKLRLTQRKPGSVGNTAITSDLTSVTVPARFSGGAHSVNSPDLVSAEMPWRDANGISLRPNTMSRAERTALGDDNMIPISYPMSASLSRIYVPQDEVTGSVHGDETEHLAGRESGTPLTRHVLKHEPSKNRKYVVALENLISNPDNLQSGNFLKHKLAKTNMICIPGIFYGSGVEKGSVSLDYYITGTMIAQTKDKFSDGRLICTVGPDDMVGDQVGTFLYNQGLAILTSSAPLGIMTDKYFSSSADDNPAWVNFGTGIKEVGQSGLEPGSCANSSYVVNFKGTNKVPTLTMFSYSEKGEHNFSNNPTFLDSLHSDSLLGEYLLTTSSFEEKKKKIKKINKSAYHDAEEDFLSTTYISKVGIYDEDKNLIAVATLANPIKKTEKRDFMIKMKIDF